MRKHTIYGVKHTFHIQTKIYPIKINYKHISLQQNRKLQFQDTYNTIIHR